MSRHPKNLYIVYSSYLNIFMWTRVRGENFPKSDSPLIPISVNQWVPNATCKVQCLSTHFQTALQSRHKHLERKLRKESAMRLSQYICFLKVTDTMLLLGGSRAFPKMQSANHAKHNTLLAGARGNFVSGYCQHVTVTCKSLMRVVKSPESEFEHCACRMSVPWALVICSL